VKIATVDEGDVDRRAAQSPNRLQASEPAADDRDAMWVGGWLVRHGILPFHTAVS
jgi:hypothetical protein